ncbi:pitrilysin family protein [Gracilibacillus sp. YIM 98692]|uniref:M16 family metallopeptidase n=1 Tax=Gracilibacillus sp. YIM 98692 TaxID=2663532 RepID=UPI001F08903B|nr:pitrilysin family protein [Gracilibacillus sp. YIM 98692]
MLHRKQSKNGLRMVLEEMTSVRSVTIGIWIEAGSRYESPQLNGISHLIEHMLFKGTENRNAQEIAEAFDAIGGEVNAFTSKEYTCVYAKVLDTHKEMAIQVLADMLHGSLFDPHELEREKKVVLEEINMTEDMPDDIIHDLLSEAVYVDHPLAYPILGSKENVSSFTREDLLAYKKRYYTPENMVVSVAGNADKSFLDKVEGYIDINTNKGALPQLQTPNFHVNQIRKTKQVEQAHVCLGYEGIPVTHRDMYHLLVLNNVLGGSMSSRLFQEVREKLGMAYAIFSYHQAFMDSGLLTIYAGTAHQQLDLVCEKMDQIIQKLHSEGIHEKELENGREQLKGILMLSLESTNSKMSRNARNELLLNRHPSLDETMNEIDQVNQKKMNELIDRFRQGKSASAIITSK